jgi:hypothetical protein
VDRQPQPKARCRPAIPMMASTRCYQTSLDVNTSQAAA